MPFFDAVTVMQQGLASLPFLLPEYVLSGGVLMLLVLQLAKVIVKGHQFAFFTFVVTLVAALLTGFRLHECPSTPLPLFNGIFELSRFAALGQLITLITLCIGICFHYWENAQKRGKSQSVEQYIMLLGLGLGVQVLCMSHHWMSIFLAIEFVSLVTYFLAANTHEKKAWSAEATLKFAIYGALSSAIMFFGLSLWYGLTGDLILKESYIIVHQNDVIPHLMALSLIFAALLYKIGAVPFHFWVPDVYQTAPTPVTALIAITTKIGAIVIIRQLMNWIDFLPDFNRFIGLVGIAMIVLGTMSAIRQTNFKRLIAYSSIGQMGLLLSLCMIPESRIVDGQIISFVIIYAMMTYGVFVTASIIAHSHAGSFDITHWKGSGTKLTIPAILLAIHLVSLIGLPPTWGFIAKWSIYTSLWQAFQATTDSLFLVILIIGLIATVVSLYFYLKPVVLLFSMDKLGVNPHYSNSVPMQMATHWLLGLSILLSMIIGIGIALPINQWITALLTTR
jgi:NADH-quinone oxidoreductase subunit N